MQYAFKFIGLDIREAPAFWTDERSAEFLLRPEIAQPLTIDGTGWPRKELSASTIFDQRELFHFEMTGKWPSEESIQQAAKEVHSSGDTLVSWRVLDPESAGLPDDESYASMTASELNEPEALHLWPLLGYDVADSAPISGLSNCGYSAEEIGVWRQEWGSKLNEYGLLASPEDAVQFCRQTNKRVPEHAPFYVFEARLVKKF